MIFAYAGYSLPGVAENGLPEQTHEAAKWQRASAMLLLTTHRKAMTLVYAKTWFYMLSCAWRSSSYVSPWRYLFSVWRSGSTGCCICENVVQQVVACLHQQPLSELSLLFCYMQPYGLLISVLHFIERAMLKVLSWASHD
jgi:hypothetical protein